MAHVCGLGCLADLAQIERTLESIMRYNFKTSLYGHFNHMRSFHMRQPLRACHASWAGVLALSGFHYSGVEQRIEFATVEHSGQVFWSNGYAWGSVCARQYRMLASPASVRPYLSCRARLRLGRSWWCGWRRGRVILDALILHA